MMGPPTDVFLSYKAEDRARLTPLVEALEAEGFTVWWDAHIGGGTNWQEDIEQHLDSAKCVLVAWSKRSVAPDGHFVRDEARRAQRRDAYLPIRLDAAEPPLGFGEIQAVSLKGWRGDRSDPRFRAVVDAIRGHVSGEHVTHPHILPRDPRLSRRAVMAGGAGVAIVAAAGGWFLLKPEAANARRIAVMPFANLSGAEDQAYFAEGIAEELRGALSRIGLQVIGRASSDAVKHLDTKAAASKLDVAHILTGSVRRSSSVVRIRAQLVNGSDGVERWAQSYDRGPGDAIRIQTDIAANVAQALSIALGEAGLAALALGGTADSAAQDLFLRAGTLVDTSSGEESIREAIALLDAAIARDPRYAEAWRLKSRLYSRLAAEYPKGPADMADKLAQAEMAAKRAIAVAPKLGSAYLTLARLEAGRLNFASAVQNMRQGLALSPDDVSVIGLASLFAQRFGDGRKALELADRAISLDPLRASGLLRKAAVLHSLRNYPQSIDACRKALEVAPDLTDAHQLMADSFVLMNRTAEARAHYAKVAADDVFRLAGEAILAARSRDIAGSDRIIAQMRGLFADTASYQYAQIHAQAGNPGRAFAELDKAVRARDPGLIQLKSDPFLDPILRDPRYDALLKRLNFPTWS
jgi:serine/threonine-protein kinase